MRTKKLCLIIGMVAAITALHYLTAASASPLHIIYRELYLIPIVLAGLRGGRRWGLITSLAVSLIYLPHMFWLAEYQAQPHHMMADDGSLAVFDSLLANSLEVVLFNLAGFLAGAYGDARAGYLRASAAPYQPAEFERSFLLYVDQHAQGLYAAKYFADVMDGLGGVKVTLVWVSEEKDPDNAPGPEEAETRQAEAQEGGRRALDQARSILLAGGLAPENVETKVLVADKRTRVSDVLLQEISDGGYHTVVLGKRELTKAQEFLFGSVSVRLLREAPVNVLAIKRPVEPEEASPA